MIDKQIVPIISVTSNSVLREKYINDIAEFCNVSKDSVIQRVNIQSPNVFGRVNSVLPKAVEINRMDALSLNIVSIMDYMKNKGQDIPVEIDELVEEN